MDYEQARAFIRRAGQYGVVYGLDGIRGLMGRLGNVQEQLSIIYVTGTNGKGSVCAMLAGILQAAGYRTGVYSSPAVFEPEEIIKVNGSCISREVFAELAGKVQAACMDMSGKGLPHPTAFEVETAIAFCFFKKEACDYVVLETGLGGEGDATNLITHPLCSVLTSISMDHMGILGHTLQEIAASEASIIKPGRPCVSAAQNPQAAKILQKTADEKGSELRMADVSCISSFSYDGVKSWFETGQGFAGTLGLAGAWQKENLACALKVVQLLREKGLRITKEAVLLGLADVRLPGRFEKISEEPEFYIDGAHNEGAARSLRETVRGCLAGRRIVYIIGVFADKEYEKLLQVMLPYAAQVFTVTPGHPRALDGEKLARLAAKFHPAVSYIPDLTQAAAQARAAAGAGGTVLAFGSFSYLGKLKMIVKTMDAANGRPE